MGSKEAGRAIRSRLRRVAIEAPAGCGKTHEAAAGAIELAADLCPGRELLLLAHTNAAVGEFRRRVRKSGARVRASTLDAFALELVTPFSAPLGLPSPLVPGDGPGQVPFQSLAPKAVELLRRAPSLAGALGRHYPVIFVDEHQDTRTEQAELVDLIVEQGEARLRTFGDPMQAIYQMESPIDWEAHCRNADGTEHLEDPRRWDDAPELGLWTLRARAALMDRDALPLQSLPTCVKVLTIPGLTDVANPNSTRVQPSLIRPLNEIVKGLSGSLALLTRYNAHVRAIRSVLGPSMIIQEGADFSVAYAALERAESSQGDPVALATTIVELLLATSTGLTQQVRNQISASILPDRIDPGRRRRVRPLLLCLEPLYAAPYLNTWCRSIRAVLTRPPDWLRIDLPLSLRVLSHLQIAEGESPRELLDSTCRRHREGAPLLRRCASTIHKAKGQAYDHVVIVNCSESVFSDSDDDRRLLYTALSRACRTLTLVVPEDGASPLIS